MISPPALLQVWKRFDDFPMETLTKAWFLKRHPQQGQRSVEEMSRHRQKTGASGNCFDLAIWLIYEFERAGISSYAVGEHLGTSQAHVGVIALDKDGRRFLCDLGDLWIQPLAIDRPSTDLQSGYFTGARIGLTQTLNQLAISYHRSNGKISHQTYDLSPITKHQLKEAGDISQRTLSPPLVEMRLYEKDETLHWEFDNFASFSSRLRGLEKEDPCSSVDAWSERISVRTGMSSSYVSECLRAYEELASAVR